MVLSAPGNNRSPGRGVYLRVFSHFPSGQATIWLPLLNTVLRRADRMPLPTLDIPSKTAAGHAAVLSASSSLSATQLEVLRLVDGRRTDDELDRLTSRPGSAWHALNRLERQGLVVRAASVCLPGEYPARRTSALQGVRSLLTRALWSTAPLSGLAVLLRVYGAPDLDSMRRLLPAVKHCLASQRRGDADLLVKLAEGLLDAP